MFCEREDFGEGGARRGLVGVVIRLVFEVVDGDGGWRSGAEEGVVEDGGDGEVDGDAAGDVGPGFDEGEGAAAVGHAVVDGDAYDYISTLQERNLHKTT